MIAAHDVDLGVACFCSLTFAAFVLRSLSTDPLAGWAPWTSPSAASSICPPAWRLGGDKNATTQDTYRQCLTRHDRDLRSGYSLQCATDTDSVVPLFAGGLPTRARRIGLERQSGKPDREHL